MSLICLFFGHTWGEYRVDPRFGMWRQCLRCNQWRRA